MYFEDHTPPHFHASYQGQEAQYNLRTLEVINGCVPRRAHVLILEWATLHRAELLANWNRAQEPSALQPIDPLE